MNDNIVQLLNEFRAQRSEAAFAEIVRRSVNLVFSVARRRLDDATLAEDATQGVFTRLAQNPPAVRTESDLLGWFHSTTIHVSVDLWRAESRRHRRELVAASAMDHSAPTEPVWNELAPQLDEAVQSLPDLDRRAILLRYFQNKAHREIGEELGVSEAAAKMRVNRAVDQLRAMFGAKGIVCTAAGLAQLLAAEVMEPAPTDLVHKVTILSRTPRPVGADAHRPVSSTVKLGFFSWVLNQFSWVKYPHAVGMVGAGIAMVVGLRTWESRGRRSDETTPSPTLPPMAQPGLSRAATVPSSRSTSTSMDPILLASLQDELRAMLNKPPVVTQHPPERLISLLKRFVHELPSAIPILTEALGADDHETRLWAMDGMANIFSSLARVSGAAESEFAAAFEIVGPRLGKLIRDEDQSDQLRLFAFQTLVCPWVGPNGEFAGTPVSAEVLDEIIASLKQPGTTSTVSSIRFTYLNILEANLTLEPDLKSEVVNAVLPLLTHPNSVDRLLAAFVAAAWSTEPVREVEQELRRQLREKPNFLHSFAANALGKLGGTAANAIPDLLKYAKEPGQNPTLQFNAAMEAVCRIQPDLRVKYPEIDARLNDQDRARELTRNPEPPFQAGPGEMLKILTDPVEGPRLIKDMLAFVRESSDPKVSLEAILANFQNWEPLLRDPVQVRQLGELLNQIKEMATNTPAANGPAVRVFELIMDARTLSVLSPERVSRERGAEVKAAIDEAEAGEEKSTGHENRAKEFEAEAFRKFSGRLKLVDPGFHRFWLAHIRKSYPWMDRRFQEEPPGE